MRLVITLICLLFGTTVMVAQDAKTKKEEKEDTTKSIADQTKTSHLLKGLFTIYQDSLTGKIKMVVREDQLDKEFIHFSQIADGVTEAGTFRGSYRGSKILKFQRHFDHIELVAPNTNFYFDPDSELARSADANTSDALLASAKIVTHEEETGRYLIEATDLFLSETLTRIKQPKRPKSSPTAFKLGSFDKKMTKIEEIKNYPENTNIKTAYLYKNPTALNMGSEAIADGRNVVIKVFHSFIAMPEQGYTPRMDDPRVGYFLTFKDDQTATGTTNYRDFINRWRLVKKNPDAPLSDPVTPITWWIENSTPKEWRETIKEGVLAWNEAFEKAGFSNAMEVKVQPDDATWDAGDIRYNVLRWTSSPNPPFGGYGPSLKNPRTGEIIGADIMLEYVHFTNRVFYDRLYNDATANMDLNDTTNDYDAKRLQDEVLLCSMGYELQESQQLGTTFLEVNKAEDWEMEGLKKEAMKSLIMHEVGHTLGLNHNMKASQVYSPAELADKDFIRGKALTGSVMDYAGINLTADRSNQGQYYDMAVGPYDIWAIQFGYTPFNSEEERNALLERSTEPELIFGNDADDMRSPGKAIDPRVMTGDLSGDPISYSVNRFKIVNDLMGQIQENFSKKGQTYEDLRRAYYVLNSQAARAGDILSRFVGGVYVERAVQGQKNATQPYTPVSFADQKRAFNALRTYVFSPSAFQAPASLYNFLARQRRGFNFFGGPEDPKIQDQVLGYQTRVLAHLMHPNTLQRISDSELYGNTYTLSLFMNDMNQAIFDADIKENVTIFRQNLQAVYVQRLIDMLNGAQAGKFKTAAKSMAIYNLESIVKKLRNPKGNLSSIAHKTHLKTLITNALQEIK